MFLLYIRFNTISILYSSLYIKFMKINVSNFYLFLFSFEETCTIICISFFIFCIIIMYNVQKERFSMYSRLFPFVHSVQFMVTVNREGSHLYSHLFPFLYSVQCTIYVMYKKKGFRLFSDICRIIKCVLLSCTVQEEGFPSVL